MLSMIKTINLKKLLILNLKLVSAIFYHIFIFLPKGSSRKTTKKAFYFIEKAFSINYFPSSPNFPDSKGQMEVE